MRLNLSSEDISHINSDLFDTSFEKIEGDKLVYGIDYADGKPIASLWYPSKRIFGNDFTKSRDAFLWILGRLVSEGRVRLHKNGVFFKSSVEGQIEFFRNSWPESEAASGYDDFYWWFFDPECPAGIAWRQDDGHYEIAT
jgi:hypothetical protein